MENENHNVSLSKVGLKTLIDSLLLQEVHLKKRIESLQIQENFVSSQQLDATKELENTRILIHYLCSK